MTGRKSGQFTSYLLALCAFIEARLDEDEAAATACLGINALARRQNGEDVPRWVQDGRQVRDDRPVVRSSFAPPTVRVGHTWVREAWHICRHDPERVLREVAAGRCMLDNYRRLIAEVDDETLTERRRDNAALTRHGCDMWAHQYAAVWADHPDYQDDFRP